MWYDFCGAPEDKAFIKIAVGGMVAVGIFLVIILVQLSSSDNFRIQRVVTWLQPDKHMAEGGYQVMQGIVCDWFRRILGQRTWEQCSEAFGNSGGTK